MSNMGQQRVSQRANPGFHIAARDRRCDTTDVGLMRFASRERMSHFSRLETFVNPYMCKLGGAAGTRQRDAGSYFRAVKGKNTEFRMANIEFFDRTMLE